MKPESQGAAIRIGERDLGPGEPCYLIAEIGSNHNGSLEMAERMVRECAAAGVDAVKFQAFTREELFIPRLPEDGSAESRRDQELLNRRWHLLPKFTSDPAWWPRLRALCADLQIDFVCTPFGLRAVQQLEAAGTVAYKLASGDITWLELIRAVARTGRPVVVSTGASTLAEVENAVSTAREAGCGELALLHCVSNYPPRWEDANLRAIGTLARRFEIPVGLSDHSPGSTLAVAALPLGCRILEKHVTLDRRQEGLDHHFALEMGELAQLVADVRHAEAALGTGAKTWAPAEEIERYWVRRGIWVSENVRAGERLTPDTFTALRPCHGMGADKVDQILGRRAARDLMIGDPVREEDLV